MCLEGDTFKIAMEKQKRKLIAAIAWIITTTAKLQDGYCTGTLTYR